MALSVTAPSFPVGRLVVRPAVEVEPCTTMVEAATVMCQENVSALVVGGSGIVTERDLTRAWSEDLEAEDPVSSVASRHPIVVDADSSIAEATATMLNQGVRHLIVKMPDGSMGVVSLRGVMAAVIQAISPEPWLTSLRVELSAAEIWWG